MMILRWLFLTKTGWIVLLVLGLMATAYAAYNREIARAEARGEARQIAAQASAMKARYDADSTAWRASFEAQRARADSLRARVDTVVQSIDRWRDHAIGNDAVIAELVGRLDDTTAAAVVAVIDTLEADLEQCIDGLTSCDALHAADSASIVLLQDRLADADSLVRSQAFAISALQDVQGKQRRCGIVAGVGLGLTYNLLSDSGANRWAAGPTGSVLFGCRF